MKRHSVKFALLASVCAAGLALTACDGEADRADNKAKTGDQVAADRTVTPDTAERKPAETTPAKPDTTEADRAPETGDRATIIKAALKSPDGKDMGTVEIGQQEDGKVVVRYQGTGLPEGDHAIHFHAKGKCDAPDFMTAGDHWRPANWKAEGDTAKVDPGHVGTISVTGNAPVSASFANAYASLKKDAPNSLFDQDGVSVVIHSKGDANADKPGGETGARLACAVIEPVPTSASMPKN